MQTDEPSVASTDSPSKGAQAAEHLFRIGFWVFAGSIGFSIAGMLLLKLVPSSLSLFGPIYPVLVKAPTWTYMTMLALLPVLMYGPTLGWRRVGLFLAWGCLIGGAGELIGTTGAMTVGGVPLPFGAYQYTEWLGPKIAGHVPYFIPPSWFAMSIVSLDLARRLSEARWTAVLLGTVFMVLWDVALDPAMSSAFPFWTYASDGFFFGMPFSNWCGWFAVTVVIMIGYELLRGDRTIHNGWAPLLYGLNCFFPLALSALNEMYLAAGVGAFVTVIPLALVWMRSRQIDHRSVSPRFS